MPDAARLSNLSQRDIGAVQLELFRVTKVQRVADKITKHYAREKPCILAGIAF